MNCLSIGGPSLFLDLVYSGFKPYIEKSRVQILVFKFEHIW